MFPEDDEVFDLDDVGSVIGVLFLDMSQQLDLNKCLLVELGLIPDDFECQMFLLLMIKHFKHLPVTALAHFLQYLIPVSYMVVQFIHVLVSTLFIVYSLLSNEKDSLVYLVGEFLLLDERFFYLS